MKITVLGAGAWGTALARLLCDGNNHVTLWGHDAAHLGDLKKTARNERYLPGIELPLDPNSEAAAAQPPGSTGNLPVPRGDPPRDRKSVV